MILNKKQLHISLLVVIIIFALFLRSYHLDYPVVGYHNWKETHYLTEARNFADDGFFSHGFFVPAYDYPSLGANSEGAHSDTFPIISVIVGLFFMIFGDHLIVARIINLLFGLGTVLMMYYFVLGLSKNKTFAYLSAIVTAFLPILVFFTHNTQLINPGLFFMVTSAYFYTKYLDKNTAKNFLYTVLFLTLATISKYTFFVIIVPYLVSFPYKKLKIKQLKKDIKTYIYSALIFSTAFLWIIYNKIIHSSIGGYSATNDALKAFSGFGIVFSSAFWQIMKVYIADNYTHVGMIFALIGLVFFFIFFKKKSNESKFIAGYTIGALLFLFLVAEKLQGHSYHQYPLVPLVAMLIAYSALVIGANIQKLSKIKHAQYLVFFVILLLIFIPSIQAKDRMFDTQFFGLDVAGEFIKQNSEESDRIIFSGHQSYGVLWHADRKGYANRLPTEEYIKSLEEEGLNPNWIFIYQWGLEILQRPEWNYIKENYKLRQIAFIGDNLFYLVLEKGGTFNESEVNKLISKNQIKSKVYERSTGNIQLNYVDIINE